MEAVFYKVSSLAILPRKEFPNSAGYDLFNPNDILVLKGRGVIKLNLKVALPYRTKMYIFSRSGIAVKGVEGWDSEEAYYRGEPPRRYNCDVLLGLVDEDFRGELGVLVHNHDEPFFIPHGAPLAQCTIDNVLDVRFREVENEDELSQTDRGIQGFHS